MKYLIFCFALAVGAQSGTPPPSSNASTLRGKGPCSATVTSDCITTNVGGTVYGGGSGAGDVAGPAASVDSEVAIYSGTGGKTLKRFNGSGVLVGTSGVVSTDSGLQFNGTTKSLGVFGPIVTGQTSNYLGQILMNGITSGTITIQPANAAGTWTWTLPANDGDSGQVLQTNGSGVTTWESAGGGSTNQNYKYITWSVDGQGSAITAVTSCKPVDFSGTINQLTATADVSGGVTLDLRTVAHASYTGPASASSIVNSNPAVLSAAAALTRSAANMSTDGWTTTLAAETDMCLVISSPSTITRLAVTVRVSAN